MPLPALGCDPAQGDLLAQPMPPADVERLLEQFTLGDAGAHPRIGHKIGDLVPCRNGRRCR